MLQTTNQAVQSADHAYMGMKERNLKNLTEEKKEIDCSFFINMTYQVFWVQMKFDGYYLEPFSKYEAPNKLKAIVAIAEDEFIKDSYMITCHATATSDTIENEIEGLTLPF